MFWDSFYSLCVASGKTPNKVAKELQIPSGSVTAWKKGSVPHPKTIQKIADYFETTVEKLLGTEKSPQPLSVDMGHREIKTAPITGSGLSAEHQKLLELFDACNDNQKRLLLEMAQMMSEKKGE